MTNILTLYLGSFVTKYRINSSKLLMNSINSQILVIAILDVIKASVITCITLTICLMIHPTKHEIIRIQSSAFCFTELDKTWKRQSEIKIIAEIILYLCNNLVNDDASTYIYQILSLVLGKKKQRYIKNLQWLIRQTKKIIVVTKELPYANRKSKLPHMPHNSKP